jgi:putative tryptophan/tyrosine transport system substrate-binding protein
MMDRRRFLLTSLAGVLARPTAAGAQRPAKAHHIGFLPAGATPAHHRQLEMLGEGLRALGYVEGQTIVISAFWPKTPSHLPEVAAEVVKRDVEVIVAPSSSAVAALKRVTQTIPIVFATTADPVGSGFVASLRRPGGNITGLSLLNNELSGKRVELMREAFPARKAVVLWFLSDDTPSVETLMTIWQETQRQGAALGVELRLLKVTRVEGLAAALAGLDARRDGGVVVLPTNLAFAHASTLAELALKQKLPTVSDVRAYADAGGLMAYGVDYDDQMRGAATYVDRILKGASPADLPVRQPSKFQFVINLKTAKALGLTIPPSLLARADQVIE